MKRIAPKGRNTFTMRITDEGKRLLRVMSESKGISKAAVAELALRHYANAQGFTVMPDIPTDSQ